MISSLNQYSMQVLSFSLEGTGKTSPLAEFDTEKQCIRHLKLASLSDKKNIIVFGLADAKLVRKLKRVIPANIELIVCELSPSRIRAEQGLLTDLLSGDNTSLICDTSIWAQFLLLNQNKISAKNSHLILNPALTAKEKEIHQRLQKLVSGVTTVPLADRSSETPELTAAAILSPEEPKLDEFIDNFPTWIKELVLIWDCQNISQAPKIKTQIKVRQAARPLEKNFSMQRNKMLELSTGKWVIYLDADERFSKQSWENIRKTIRTTEVDAIYLPRKTFYPDEKNCRIGYGLWPDLQLRLFRNSGQLVFKRPIHELLTGFNKAAISTGAEILHRTHLLKDREAIEKKLSIFDGASGDRITHHFGQELPSLPCEMLSGPENNKDCLLILPDGSAF